MVEEDVEEDVVVDAVVEEGAVVEAEDDNSPWGNYREEIVKSHFHNVNNLYLHNNKRM